MTLVFEERPSDSPLVATIWRTESERAGAFISRAESRWEIVVTKIDGKTRINVRGPETRATRADCPPDGEFFGIAFKVGTFMPHLPARLIMDRRDPALPEATGKSFWLNSSAWEYPDFDNADTFVSRLVREGLLARDPVVEAVLRGELKDDLSLRSIQRRFIHTTGLSHRAVYQIQRAQQAAALLEQGTSILDTVERAGYADQSHLTRALRYFVGYTPARIADIFSSEQLSQTFKTMPFC